MKAVTNIIDSCSIASGELPSGLTLVKGDNSCDISGSTNQLMDQSLTTFNISHAGESITTALILTVTPKKPQIVDRIIEGRTGESLRVSMLTGWEPETRCSISSSVPSGLRFSRFCLYSGRHTQPIV